MNTPIEAPAPQALDPSLVSYTHVIYALHALSVLIGVTSTTLIFTAFVFGLPSIIAVIMNYVRLSAARGTWLESHFRWQIRTFWFALLWGCAIAAIGALLLIVLIGIVIWWVGFIALGLWVIYRVARGWLALKDGRPMYA
jgi:uncharacterized membrane protein